jgi:thioesterase domain-containing protein
MWYYPLAIGAYTPPVLRVPVCHFEAMEHTGPGLARMWQAYLAETAVRTTPVPGTHTSIMGPDHVAALGQALSRELARAATDGAVPAEAGATAALAYA